MSDCSAINCGFEKGHDGLHEGEWIQKMRNAKAMTTPKPDEAMEIAERWETMPPGLLLGGVDAQGHDYSWHKRNQERLAALIRPHLSPAPAVPEEVERVAKGLADIANQQHCGDRPDTDANEQRCLLEMQASTLLRSMAGEIAGLRKELTRLHGGLER